MRVGEVIAATHNEQPTERASKCKQSASKVQAECKQSASLHTLRKSLIIISENTKSARCKHFSQKQIGWEFLEGSWVGCSK